MSFVVLDTDVSSQLQKGLLPAGPEWQIAPEKMCITFVTVGELATWTEVRSWGPRSRARLNSWLHEVVVLQSSDRVSHTWGRLAARARRRGRPRPVNDMWIAACALAYGLPLATFNVKDFADFAEYDGLRLLGLYPRVAAVRSPGSGCGMAPQYRQRGFAGTTSYRHARACYV